MRPPRQQTIRVTANEEKARPESHVSWRVAVSRLWGHRRGGPVVLRAYFDERCIAAVRASEWAHSPQKQELGQLERLLDDELDLRTARDVRRSIACAVFDARLASGKLTIPKEIVWLLAQDNPARDLTVINVGLYLEVWPTLVWQQRMRAHAREVKSTQT